MRNRFEIKVFSESIILELTDEAGRNYAVEIGPKRAAEYFANLFLDGIINRGNTEVKVKDLRRRNLEKASCHVALFKDRGLFKCSTPTTGESRNLEIYPRDFAVWLAECLESREGTRVDYEVFD